MARGTTALVVAVAVLVDAALLALPSALCGDAGVLLRDLPCLCLVASASLLCAVEAMATDRSRDTARPLTAWRDSGHFISLVSGVSLLVTFWLCIAERLDRVVLACTTPSARVIAGTALALGGITLRWSAIRALGRSFVSAPRVRALQTLETRGVFHAVRHPSEAGLLALAIGAVVLCESWAGAAVTLTCTLPSCVVRILREDRCLAAAYGEDHRAYSRTVRALLPGVW